MTVSFHCEVILCSRQDFENPRIYTQMLFCVPRSSPNSQSQILAIEGMLSMSRGPRDSSLFAPLSRGMCKTNRLQRTVKDEEEQLMADCYQDGEYSKLFLSHSLLRYSAASGAEWLWLKFSAVERFVCWAGALW